MKKLTEEDFVFDGAIEGCNLWEVEEERDRARFKVTLKSDQDVSFYFRRGNAFTAEHLSKIAKKCYNMYINPDYYLDYYLDEENVLDDLEKLLNKIT